MPHPTSIFIRPWTQKTTRRTWPFLSVITSPPSLETGNTALWTLSSLDLEQVIPFWPQLTSAAESALNRDPEAPSPSAKSRGSIFALINGALLPELSPLPWPKPLFFGRRRKFNNFHDWPNIILVKICAHFLYFCWLTNCPSALNKETGAQLRVPLSPLHVKMWVMQKTGWMEFGLGFCLGCCSQGWVEGERKSRNILNDCFPLSWIKYKKLFISQLLKLL